MLEYLLSLLLVYQYTLIFCVSIFASFGIPLPATAILIAGGAFYAQGYFDIYSLFLAGFLGCSSGDLLGYMLAYLYGKSIFIRIGLGKIINFDAIISKYGNSFSSKSILFVFLSRWLFTSFGPSINILAGILKMRPLHFFLTDLLGEALYISIVITIGYSFGMQWESILDIIESFSTMIASLALLIITFSLLWRYHKRGSRKIKQ